MAEASISRAARLLDMVPFLIRNQGIPLSELCERFSLTENELYEDLNLLFVCGLPGYLPDDLIDISFEDGFVTVSNPQKFDRPRKLNNSELSLLLLSLNFLKSGLPKSHQSAVEALIQKINKNFDAYKEIEIIDLNNDHELLDLAGLAIKNRCAVKFDYISTNSDTSLLRNVFPVSIEIGLKENYLSGIDYQDGKLKSFRFSRLSNLIINEKQVIPEEVQISLYPEPKAPNIARLLISQDGIQFIEDERSILKIISESDLGTTVDIEYWNEDWLIRRVRSFAPAIRIIEPETLKAEFLRRVAGVLARYRS
jgi:proteasome accessory factor C